MLVSCRTYPEVVEITIQHITHYLHEPTMKTNYLILLFLLSGLQSVFADNDNSTETASSSSLPFDVYTVEAKDYRQFRTFDATVEAVRRATVSSETNGRVSEINFDVDDFVEKGSVLIRITAAATRAKLSGVEANVSEMQAQHDIALSEFNRVKNVFERQLVSRSVFDKAEAELKAAKERLTAARARVKEVLEQLKYKVVKAPYSGVVAERHVELGEMVNVGQALMTGYSQNELRVVTHIPQSMVDTIRQTASARIMIDDNPESDLHSNLVTVYPDADPVSHTYKVRIKLPTTPKGIYPGHFVKVQFPVATRTAIRVPAKSVLQRSELQAVYVVSGNDVSLRQIRLGDRDENNMVEILAGLSAGEKVSLDPVSAGVFLKSKTTR